MKPRVAILCSGRGSNMEALIKAAQNPDYPAEIALVISNKADAPALEIARGFGVQAIAVPGKSFGADRAAHERAIDAHLAEHNIEIVCLAGYMRLLTPYLVGRWRGRMLNIHPSLLPQFPGLDTHARALAAAVQTHGCTVHLVTEEMDAGPIIAQADVSILPHDTEETLAARVLAQEHRIYPKALAELARKSACQRPLPNRKHHPEMKVMNTMTTETNQGTALPAEQDFDNNAQKGWNFFTKFLLSNVILTAGALIVIAIFTVWS